MKNILLACSATLMVYAFNSCKSKNSNNGETISGTDSSMMTTPTSTESGLPSTVKPDSNTNPSASQLSDTTSMVNPNPGKKGKKGTVSMNFDKPKITGKEDVTDREGYYTNVYPAYPGGNNALAKFFEDNIQYPQSASDNGVEGTVNINFIVDEKGNIVSPKITSPRLGYGIEEEALRVFNKMPLWAPASLRGKNVKTKYNLPVRFQLES